MNNDQNRNGSAVLGGTDWPGTQRGATLDQIRRAYGGFLPPLDTGFGPAFGGGWQTGSFSGQIGEQMGVGTVNIPAELSDQQVQNLIYDALDNDPRVPGDANIELDVKNGTATIAGTVRNKSVKRAVDDDVWATPGVRDVNNKIQIKGRNQQAQAGGATTGKAGAAAKTGSTARTGAAKTGATGTAGKTTKATSPKT